MDIFDLDSAIVSDYKQFARSFSTIKAPDLKTEIDGIYASGRFWPEPILQLNPHYKQGRSIHDLVQDSVLDPACASYFLNPRRTPHEGDPTMTLRVHQTEAIVKARQGRSFVVTTGTGSGKSLCFFIPIIDAAIRDKRAGEGARTRAIIVYPMNALANSQLGELSKFLEPKEGLPRVTFARYTGQETQEEREAIRSNPPDILLTNFMMLELLMTRQSSLDQKVIENCEGLNFIVLDELHTYRGRQGADVAMLVRRVRERLENPERPIQCVGTSATMASEGSRASKDTTVASVASRLFGTNIAPDCIITETLRRQTDATRHADSEKERLASIIAAGTPDTLSNAELALHPLAIWVETRLGLEQSESGNWQRAKPLRISEAATLLANDSGCSPHECGEALKKLLLVASRPEKERVDGGEDDAFFAFKLHRFFGGAGRAYTSLDLPGERRVTADGQVFDPKDQRKRLFALYFCRNCGQEFHPVKLYEEGGRQRFIARAIDDVPPAGDAETEDDEAKEVYGFLMPENESSSFDGRDESYPEAWQEITPKGEVRLKATYRKVRARSLKVDVSGSVGSGAGFWFLPGRFRFCPGCGDVHTTAGRDINRLAGLSAEGRSSATTILVSAILRWMNGPASSMIEDHRRKLLGFTDNRQDAALQAGHFNDFVYVTRLRAAILAALAEAGPDGLDEAAVAAEMQKALGFTRDREELREEWLYEARLKGANLINAEADLRSVLLHRFWVDQRRGWRFTHPNLEELGFLAADYISLDELVADEEVYADAPDVLKFAGPETREQAFRELFDYMRKGLAVATDALDDLRIESLKQKSMNVHRAPWGFGRDERPRPAPQMMLTPPSRREIKIKDEPLLLRGGARTLLGRALRKPALWSEAVAEKDYDELLLAMLDAAKTYGLVSASVTPFGRAEDGLGWRLQGNAVRFHRREVNQNVEPGRKIPNPYFVSLYESLAAELAHAAGPRPRIEGREHTAQVAPDLRVIREERFRFEEEDRQKLREKPEKLRDFQEDERFLPILFCSPTMELGVDISALNAVYMRNVPPTPANYAQRSGRAGRSGQAALVVTYCADQSPHDQYYFADQRAMVHGVVNPPALDLSNRELVASHLNAIWLAETQEPLDPGISEILDLTKPGYPIKAFIRDKLALDEVSARALPRMNGFVAQLADELVPEKAPWFSTGEELVSKSAEEALGQFEASFARWRDLFAAATRQLKEANRTVEDHSTPPKELKIARAQAGQASDQLDLLRRPSASQSNDFYTYRYLATEGFLPGYNFPRLPLMAYIPSTRDGLGKQTFLQRARFLGISEFGPRSLVYHEGRAFRVAKAMLTPSVRGGEGGKLATKALDVCSSCGASHEHRSRETCHACGASLSDAPIIRDVFRVENVETLPAERITINNEDRQRQGFEIQTIFAWASRNNRIDVRRSVIRERETDLFNLSYGPGAAITRLNKGLRRRKVKADLGFMIDPRTGYWAKNDEEEGTDDVDRVPKQKVVPAVEESKNALLMRPSGGDLTLEAVAMTTLQHALLRGLETVYQLEQGEILAEPLPNRDDRRAILFYEASEGGAGVLSRLGTEPDAMADIARAALSIMHYDVPDSLDGIGAGELNEHTDACAKGCYRCVLSYYNQPDHESIDRQSRDVMNALVRIARSRVEPEFRARPEAGSGAQSPPPALSERFLTALALREIDPPDEQLVTNSESISSWSEHCVAVWFGDPPETVQAFLSGKGYDLVVFPSDEALWPASFDRLSSFIHG